MADEGLFAIDDREKFVEYERRKKEIPSDVTSAEYLEYVTRIAEELGL